MILKNMEIRGFRSLKHKVTIPIDSRATVFVGANDHGKSNILDALCALNSDFEFKDDDRNWDLDDDADAPSIRFDLALQDNEREELLGIVNTKIEAAATARELDDEEFVALREQVESAESEVATRNQESETIQNALKQARHQLDANPANASLKQNLANAAIAAKAAAIAINEAESQLSEAGAALEQAESARATDESPRALKLDQIPCAIMLTVTPSGRETDLGIQPELDSDTAWDFIESHCPRVELIQPVKKVVDSASFADLNDDANEFMKGIFYYAGLHRDEWELLFEQNNSTTYRLDKASKVLDASLKSAWSHGQSLTFKLDHESKEAAINLLIQDPSVTSRFVTASTRSSGFTHYFSLKTILHARALEHPASSYLWLFDEPGIYLHPAAQNDLIHELEVISKQNQVGYTTHSLFMLNKNFPTRHRLVVKDTMGTRVELKPFIGRWQRVLGALGITEFGTIIFGNHILIVEGDSDPIYLLAMLQRLVSDRVVDLDLNGLSIIAAQTSPEAETLIRLCRESSPTPRIGLLFDGDQGGLNRRKALSHTIKKFELPELVLKPKDSTTEDHIVGAKDLLPKALGRHLAKMEGAWENEGETKKLIKVVTGLVNELLGPEAQAGLANALTEAAKDKVESGKPSKLGIAREYAELVSDDQWSLPANSDMTSAIELSEWIKKNLGVSGIEEEPGGVLVSE